MLFSTAARRRYPPVDNEDISDLHDSGLDRLHCIPHPGNHHNNNRMGMVDDIHFLLAGSHGLNDDDILTHGIENMNGISNGIRQSSKSAACGKTPHKNARILGVTLHSDAIAQNCAACKGACRINSKNAHRPIICTQYRNQCIGEGAFSGSRGSGDSDNMRSARIGEKIFDNLPGFRTLIL
jgi:hypothetical protein